MSDLRSFLLDSGEFMTEKNNELYGFNWLGKNDAKLEALKPAEKCLVPKKNKSGNSNKTKNIYIEGDNLEALKILQKDQIN